jgi:uncharacterized protein with FMN-binding domain
MRRIVLWAMSTLTVLVLLFSYNTSRSSSAAQVTAETRSATSSGQAASGSSSSSSSSSGSSGSSSSGSSSSASGTTVAGDEVMTRYGVVQVQITVQNGKITSSKVLQVPWNDRHDQMINSSAVPVYNEETVAAQSAGIDVVSGATVTWQGYTQSLQSAIDKANL